MPLLARDVMTTELITVTPDTPLSEFARICAEDNISGCPVTRVDGMLCGIVSKTDLLNRLLEEHPRHGSKREYPVWDEDVRQVADIMTERVLTVGPSTPLAEIAERMARDRFHRVVVMEGDKMLGIVTSIDLLSHFPRGK
ncbi:MAG: CBS domain-containing protein [Planctomycetota bacterium]